jgi:hypothetical protein
LRDGRSPEYAERAHTGALSRSPRLTLEAEVKHVVRVGVVSPAVAVALLVTACDSSFQDNPFPARGGAATASLAPSPGSPAAPEVTAQEAQDIALAAVGGGLIMSTEIEEEDDLFHVWEVVVLTSDGLRREVSVDIADGRVLANDVED